MRRIINSTYITLDGVSEDPRESLIEGARATTR
jgi:hypothetical protein